MNKNAHYVLSKRIGNNPNVQQGIVQRGTSTPWNAGQPSEMPIMKTMQKYEIMLTMGYKIKRIHKAALIRTAAMKNKPAYEQGHFKSKNVCCVRIMGLQGAYFLSFFHF